MTRTPPVFGEPMSLRIFASELEVVQVAIEQYLDLETGGHLFGLYGRDGVPVIYLATGPGHGSRHNPTSFYPQTDYLAAVTERLYDAYGLQHIGEWHSHHQLGLPTPSGGDDHTVWTGLDDLDTDRWVLGIGTLEGGRRGLRASPTHSTLGLWIYDRTTRTRHQCQIETLPGTSPVREVARGLPRAPADHRIAHLPLTLLQPGGRSLDPRQDGWLADPVVQARLMSELRDLELLPAHGWQARMLPRDGTLVLECTGPDATLRWALDRNFPQSGPRPLTAQPMTAWHVGRTLFDVVCEAIYPPVEDLLELAPIEEPEPAENPEPAEEPVPEEASEAPAPAEEPEPAACAPEGAGPGATCVVLDPVFRDDPADLPEEDEPTEEVIPTTLLGPCLLSLSADS